MGAALFYAVREDYRYDDKKEEPHFLQSCTLCSKHIGFDADIFMYRGNSPFCSKECRQEQIDMDEANERRRKRMLRSIDDKIPASSFDKIVAASS